MNILQTNQQVFGQSVFQTNVKKQKKAQQLTSSGYSKSRLVTLWGLILIGYFLFVVQWYSIISFQGTGQNGWGAAFFEPGVSIAPAVTGSLNWTITLGRAAGSILAGWLIAKIGHKYAVITVLSLMLLSFPFLIVSQNAEWNALSILGGAATSNGISTSGMALFVTFRIFLAVGGTTLITYTNSVIAKMDDQDRAKFMTVNQFGFNGGALIANIFFVIPGAIAAITGNPAVWTGILSSFIVLVLVILILYLLYGIEVVPKTDKKQVTASPDQLTIGKVVKEKDTIVLSSMFIIWLISVVFITSSTMRAFVEQSPANFRALAIARALNTDLEHPVTNISTSPYYWVWPAFTCLFVSGFFVGVFSFATFGKTIFERKNFVRTMFALGYVCMIISLLCGSLLGYDNQAALATMLVFIFMSGFFLWSVQAVLLTIPQQLRKTNAKYMGIVAGLIWGIGYLGYTFGEILMSLLTSYAGAFTDFNKNFISVGDQIKAAVTASADTLNYSSALNQFNDFFNNPSSLSEGLIKTTETSGTIISFVIYWIVLLGIFPLTFIQPKPGYRNKNNEFIEFTEKWNPLKNWRHLNVVDKKYSIASYANI